MKRALGPPSAWAGYYPEPFTETEQRYRSITWFDGARGIASTALTGSRHARRKARLLLLAHVLLALLICGICVVLSSF